MDNIFIQMEQRLIEITFKNNQGFMDFGKYKLANVNTDQYFTKLNNKWYQEIYSSRSKEVSERVEKKEDGDDNDGNDNIDGSNNNQ